MEWAREKIIHGQADRFARTLWIDRYLHHLPFERSFVVCYYCRLQYYLVPGDSSFPTAVIVLETCVRSPSIMSSGGFGGGSMT